MASDEYPQYENINTFPLEKKKKKKSALSEVTYRCTKKRQS